MFPVLWTAYHMLVLQPGVWNRELVSYTITGAEKPGWVSVRWFNVLTLPIMRPYWSFDQTQPALEEFEGSHASLTVKHLFSDEHTECANIHKNSKNVMRFTVIATHRSVIWAYQEYLKQDCTPKLVAKQHLWYLWTFTKWVLASYTDIW